MTGVPVVKLVDVSVAFPGTLALDRVSLSLLAGEVHALMGLNAAGKSTIVKVLSGVLRTSGGQILVDGVGRRFDSPAASRAAGIATVFQDIGLCPMLSVAENVMLGHEVRGRFGIDWRATRAVAAQTLGELGLGGIDPRTRLQDHSPAVQQLVAIARAMVPNPRVVLLDEPTSSLDEGEVALLFGVVRKMRERGVAVVFITHFLEQAFAISDKMTVLRDGRVEGGYLTRELGRTELLAKMIGKGIDALKAIGSERSEHRQDPEGDPILVAEGVSLASRVGKSDLELYPGEIVGLAGLRGSGRTPLALLLAGVESPTSGTVFLDGTPLRQGTGLRRHVALATEDRLVDGIIADLSVSDNIVLALQSTRGWWRPVSARERAELVTWYLDRFRIDPPEPDQPAGLLSGGSQQKVLLARWLATRPRVLLLDEPTKGIDIAAKVDIQRLIARQADEGVAVLLISSELEEVVRLADRIVVLKDGVKLGELSNGPAVTVDTIVELIASK